MVSVCCSYKVLEAKLAPSVPVFASPVVLGFPQRLLEASKRHSSRRCIPQLLYWSPRDLDDDVEGKRLWSYSWQSFSEPTFIRASPFSSPCLSLIADTGRLEKVEIGTSIPPGWLGSGKTSAG